MSGPSLFATFVFLAMAFLLFAIGSEIYQVGKIVKASKPKATKNSPDRLHL